MADEVIKTVLTADDSGFRASFNRAADTLKKHEARIEDLKKKSLARATEELRALKLEAGGQKEAAAALRETLSLKEKALAMAKQTGLSEQASMVLLQKRMALEKQVAAESVRRSQPVSLSGLPVNNLQQLDKWNRVAAQSQKEMMRMRGSGMNASMGLLEVSRAAEDAQYGLRGVINNVPGIVQSFGGSAGIAGAVSLAVVAFYQLGKAYLSYLDSIDNGKGFKAGQEALESTLKTSREQIRVLREEEEIRASMTAYGKEYAALLEKELSIQRGVSDVIEGQIQQRQRARQLADEIAAAEERLAAARGQASPGRGGQDASRLEEDLKSQQALLKAINAEASRLDFNRQGFRESIDSQIEASQAEIESVRDRLLETEARMNQAAAVLENTAVGRGQTGARQNVKTLTDARNQLQNELKFLEAKVAELRNAAASAETQGRAGMDAINERIAATMNEIKSTKELIDQRKVLDRIAAETAAVEREKRMNELLKERKANLESINRVLVQGMEREAERMRVMQEQTRARTDFGTELQALKLEASGRKDMADALRTEMRIRQDARDLAERTGISEEKATALVRERERLLRRLRDGERGETGAESRLRRSSRETIRRIEASPSRRIEAGTRTIEAAGWRRGSLTRTGLRESELARQAQVKAMTAKDTGEAKAAKYWERSIDLQETMLKVFNQMGAI